MHRKQEKNCIKGRGVNPYAGDQTADQAESTCPTRFLALVHDHQADCRDDEDQDHGDQGLVRGGRMLLGQVVQGNVAGGVGDLKILHRVGVLGNHFGHFCNAAAAALQVLGEGWHEHHTAQQHSHKESQSHVQRCVC